MRAQFDVVVAVTFPASLPAPRESMSLKEWIDLLLNVDVDVSSGTITSGWDDTIAKRMARVKFVQTVLLTANGRTGIWNERGFVWTGGSFLPVFECSQFSNSPSSSPLRCLRACAMFSAV